MAQPKPTLLAIPAQAQGADGLVTGGLCPALPRRRGGLQRGSEHFYFSTCRTESATHTLSATVCQHGPKGPGEGHKPLVLSEIFLQKSPSQITGSQSPVQLAQGRSVWGQELELFLGAAAEGTSCRRQVPQFQFKTHIRELLTKKPKQGPKKGHPALVFGS